MVYFKTALFIVGGEELGHFGKRGQRNKAEKICVQKGLGRAREKGEREAAVEKIRIPSDSYQEAMIMVIHSGGHYLCSERQKRATRKRKQKKRQLCTKRRQKRQNLYFFYFRFQYNICLGAIYMTKGLGSECYNVSMKLFHAYMT